eukprot:5718680-Amphidinium_carterae.1
MFVNRAVQVLLHEERASISQEALGNLHGTCDFSLRLSAIKDASGDADMDDGSNTVHVDMDGMFS